MEQKTEIITVKCCHNCKHYKPDPIDTWGSPDDKMCWLHDKATREDEFCNKHELNRDI